MRRREFLAAIGSLPILTVLPGITLARTGSQRRLVLVLLRGAMDGLSAVPPYGDPNYQGRGSSLALPKPGASDGVLDLDGFFGLHPELGGLYRHYGQRQLAVIHSVASPYRDRSHFDGQDALENGTATSTGARNGWLNRALGRIDPPPTDEAGIALGQTVPLVLRGDVSVTSWAPSALPQIGSDTLERIAWMYDGDPLLAERLQQALAADALADSGMDAGRPSFRRGQEFATLARAAGRFLTADDGPDVAVLESDGWDTHANQGARNGQLAKRLGELDKGLAELRSTLGDAWDTTVVVVVTEFGRTVAANGSRGTDHGTGSCAFVLGGPVRGGRVIADWPGLRERDLYEGRDLMPTTDLRGVFKGVLRDHLGLSPSDLGAVFPGSGAVAPIDGLV